LATALNAYLESSVLSADPVQLVQILYGVALDSVEGARRHLRAGDIASRSREIGKACAILAELEMSLNREAGGSLAKNLVELYDYMQRRLLQANIEQSEPPLTEVSKLLSEIREAWKSVG
jgi:flagellar protein FliS